MNSINQQTTPTFLSFYLVSVTRYLLLHYNCVVAKSIYGNRDFCIQCLGVNKGSLTKVEE